MTTVIRNAKTLRGACGAIKKYAAGLGYSDALEETTFQVWTPKRALELDWYGCATAGSWQIAWEGGPFEWALEFAGLANAGLIPGFDAERFFAEPVAGWLLSVQEA